MTWIRKVAERASQNVVLKRRLPREFGNVELFVSPDARLNLWRGQPAKAETHLLAAVNEFVRPGSIVWDVGANVGLFSFSAAALAGASGRVLAIDADPWLCSLLRRSASLPNVARAKVDVISAAISDKIGILEFVIARRGRASNHLAGFGSTQAGGSRETISVPTLTLDSLLGVYPPPAVLKIDVEGAEMNVLRGAASLLRTHKPAVICEVFSASASGVTELLRDNGYVLFDGDAPRSKRVPLTQAAWNTLATPCNSF